MSAKLTELTELTELDKIAIRAIDMWNHGEGDAFLAARVSLFAKVAARTLLECSHAGKELPPLTDVASLFAQWGRTHDDTLLFVAVTLIEKMPQAQLEAVLQEGK